MQASVIFKWVSVSILFITGVLFLVDGLPPYVTITPYAKYIWAVVLVFTALLQAVLTVANNKRKCLKCKVWGYFLLQLSGLLFLILSSIFGATYPPFSWAMGVFPVVGIAFILAGRTYSQETRDKIMVG